MLVKIEDISSLPNSIPVTAENETQSTATGDTEPWKHSGAKLKMMREIKEMLADTMPESELDRIIEEMLAV